MKTLILVRHGESITNLSKVFTGQINAPLTETGRKQAEKMARYLDSYPIDKIYVSSLQRAVDTASEIALRQKCPMEHRDDFREINAGLWQGLTFEEIANRYPTSYKVWREDIGGAHPEGGESVAQLYSRVSKAFSHIVQNCAEKTVCIVAHAIPIRMIESYICAQTPAAAKDIPWVPNASVTVYTYDGSYRLVRRGECCFLQDMLTNLPSSI